MSKDRLTAAMEAFERIMGAAEGLFYLPRPTDLVYRKKGFVHLDPGEGWDITLQKPQAYGQMIVFLTITFPDATSASNTDIKIIQSGVVTTGIDAQKITEVPTGGEQGPEETVIPWHWQARFVVSNEKRVGFRCVNTSDVVETWLEFEFMWWFVEKPKAQTNGGLR